MTGRSTTQAVATAVAVARAHGLRVDDPQVLAEGYSVRVHVAPSPVVVRVPTVAAETRPPIRAWLERELAVTSWLRGRGAPVVPPTDLADPGPHEHDGAVVSLWELVDVDPEPVPPADFGVALGELHLVLAGYPGDLPVLPGPRTDVTAGLAACEGRLPAEALEVARAARDRLAAWFDDDVDGLVPVHGDSHTGNLLRTRGGALLWNDWEDVGRGPVEWDLASLTLGREVAAAYPRALDPERLGACRELRRLQVLVGTVGAGFAVDAPTLSGWVDALRGARTAP